MTSFRPRIEDATDTNSRMDALCEFIEFWLGPRQALYGEPPESLAALDSPMPLHRLYAFAGRWPNSQNQGYVGYAVPAFSTQDTLALLHELKIETGGKLVFLYENQGVWDCRTLTEGNNPPVWCCGDQMDENGKWFTGEKLVCDSLSRFLVTFVLQEITLGARLYLCDKVLAALFESESSSALPVWTEGKYVYNRPASCFLWGHVLVERSGDHYVFGANDDEGIRFLTENQGPINMIGLIIGRPWTLDIETDGSASLRYLKGQISEVVNAPPNTFDFPMLLEALSAVASDEGHFEQNAMVFFRRKSQSSGVRAKSLRNGDTVTSLFQLALERAIESNGVITQRFKDEWPL